MTEQGEPTPSHEYFLELARTLPKIDVNDPRVRAFVAADEEGRASIEIEIVNPVYNNYFLLFEARRLQATHPERVKGIEQVYLRTAEEIGEPWQRFLAENGELLGEIDAALEAREPFSDLFKYYRDLLRARKFGEEDAIDDATGHPLGISAIAVPLVDRLNPLLERASIAMQASGIDPQLYGLGREIN